MDYSNMILLACKNTYLTTDAYDLIRYHERLYSQQKITNYFI